MDIQATEPGEHKVTHTKQHDELGNPVYVKENPHTLSRGIT